MEVKAPSEQEDGEKGEAVSHENEAKAQPQQGRRKKNKKQKWKALDMSSIEVPSAQQQTSSHSYQPKEYHQSQSHSSWGGSSSGRGQGNFTGQRRYESQDFGYQERGSNIALSKALVTLLRHRKPRDINIDGAGYAFVSDILQHPQFQRFHTTERDIFDIIQGDNKKRYETKGSVGVDLQVRATQGHSFKLEAEMSGLELITNSADYPTVVHGTYKESWRFIKKEGLKKMSRTYVHFAIGHIGETHVTSGMRYSCDIVIELDLEKAIAGGLKFYASKNKVVLCEGDETGAISPKYFKSVKKYDNQAGKFVDTNFVFEE